MRNAGILIATAILFGCGASAGEYRGISSRSTCSSVLDTEQRLGAKLTGQRQESGASGPVEVHELTGEIGSVPVRIDVACDGANLYMVVFNAQVSSDSAASEAFDRLRASMAGQFHAAQVNDRKHGRSATFECKPAGLSVSLVEDLVSQGAPKSSAALLVVPRPGTC